MRHPGSFDGKDGHPYVGSRGLGAGKFSIALDRRKGPSGQPLSATDTKYRPVTLRELAEYARNRDKHPHLRVRCKTDQAGTRPNGGRFLREIVIDWECLRRCGAELR